ncbi:MAG: hypothetical protein ABW252_15525 [Polyangiales bacterium]
MMDKTQKNTKIRGLLAHIAATLFVLLAASAAHAQSVSGSDDGGDVIRGGSHTGVPLLSQVYARFRNGDHHVRSVGVLIDTPRLFETQLYFRDVNSDDPFDYAYRYWDVGPSGIYATSTGTRGCRGTCTTSIARPAGDYVFVLRGFYFSYRGTDNHLTRVRIGESGGSLTVSFHDQSPSEAADDFDYIVQYAYVPRSRIVASGTVGGGANGSQSKPIAGGAAVIRGFSLSYLSSDHHVEELGLNVGSGVATAHFNDNNNDDAFDWSIDWGIVN